MINALIAAAGSAIVLAVALDIFRSLLVPRASGRWLRVGPLLNTALFSAWHTAAGWIKRPRMRQTVRASFAPLMLVLIMGIWSGLLIMGFGLIFWAGRGGFRPSFQSFGDAVYAAGSAFSTLGVNGTVSGNLTRLMVLVCSVAGLAIVTVVATFLISIQGGFGRRETLVLQLESHVTLPPAGIAILETYAGEAIVERLGAFFSAWELWAAEVAVSHRAFPILIYFRSNDDRCEWLAAFGAVMDAAALFDATVVEGPASAHAGAHFVLRTGVRVLCDMARQFGANEITGDEIVDRERFLKHRARLVKAGYTVVPDERAAFETFKQRRTSYAASLVYLGHRLRIDVDERKGDEIDSQPQG